MRSYIPDRFSSDTGRTRRLHLLERLANTNAQAQAFIDGSGWSEAAWWLRSFRILPQNALRIRHAHNGSRAPMLGGTQAAVDRGNLAEDLAFSQISEQQGSAVRRIDKDIISRWPSRAQSDYRKINLFDQMAIPICEGSPIWVSSLIVRLSKMSSCSDGVSHSFHGTQTSEYCVRLPRSSNSGPSRMRGFSL